MPTSGDCVTVVSSVGKSRGTDLLNNHPNGDLHGCATTEIRVYSGEISIHCGRYHRGIEPMKTALLATCIMAALLTVGAAGCRRGEVVERVAPTQLLGSYRTVSVQVTAAGPVSMHDLTDLHDELSSRLAASALVGQVVRQGSPSELVVRATILRRTEADSFFDSGPVELTVGVQLLDNLRHQVVGQFDATSSSSKPAYRRSGDDAPSSLGNDPSERAIRSVVGEIVRYLEEQTGK
jgi:hypothetical protein